MRQVTLNHGDLAEIGSDILSGGGTFHFKAYGSSMYPFICNGDTLTIQPVDIVRLKTGDVVLFTSHDGRIKVHRIIRKNIQREGVKFIMRGDSTLYSDGWILPEQILGKVDTVIRNRKDIRLDSRFLKLLTNLWMKSYPLGALLLKTKPKSKQVASLLLRQVQARKSYRAVANKLFKNKISYRVATADDVPLLSKFYAYEKLSNVAGSIQLSEKAFSSLKGERHTLIARLRGKIIGATVITRFPYDEVSYPDWWIFGMKVRIPYRGMGIGERLVAKAIEKASEEGACRLNLLVFKKNKAASNLYHKMGFRQISIPALDKQLEEEAKQTNQRRIILSKELLRS